MTTLLYMPNIDANYIKEFTAKVIERKENYFILDKTAFYPLGGGQPSDIGFLISKEKKFKVIEAQKREGIKHFVQEIAEINFPIPELNEDEIFGVIDWDKRYAHMKMHTSQHVISGVVFDLFNGRTVGNQIHAEYSRVDFSPVKFSDEDVKKIEEKCNEIIAKNLQVKIYEEERESLEKRVNEQRANLDLLPKSIRNLRIVDIDRFDICPCAGTHVKNTSELGKLEIIKRETKGKDKERIVYRLV